MRVTNPLDEARPDALVVVPRLWLAALGDGPYVVRRAGLEVPSQRDDLDGDGQWDEVVLLVDLLPNEAVEVEVSAGDPSVYEPRTQADIQVREGGAFGPDGVYRGGRMARVASVDVPDEQARDSKYAYAEGPTWETDRVGFRVYMDERARVDVFGKAGGPPVLHDLGPSYHTLNDWGADVLKVGESLGLGTPGAVRDDGSFQTLGTPDRVEVVASGPIRSILRWIVEEWVVDGETYRATWEVEAHAGQRHAESRLRVTRSGGPPTNLRLVTGIVRHPAAPDLVTSREASHLVAFTWGDQADQGDGLGLAVVVPEAYGPRQLDTEDTFALTLEPVDGAIRYLLAAAWSREDDPLPSGEAFRQHLEAVARRAVAPVVVRPGG